MKKVIDLKIVLLCVSTLFLLGLGSCSSDESDSVGNNDVSDLTMYFDDEEKPDSLLDDSLKVAYNMIYGQWKKVFYMDGYKGSEITGGSVLTVKKNKTFSFTSDPDNICKFKIAKIYRLSHDTLYSLVCHQGFDGLNSSHDFFRYDIEGDVLNVKEEHFGTDFYDKRWRFKKIR